MQNYYKDGVIPSIDEFYTEDEFSNDYSGYYSGDINDITMLASAMFILIDEDI